MFLFFFFGGRIDWVMNLPTAGNGNLSSFAIGELNGTLLVVCLPFPSHIFQKKKNHSFSSFSFSIGLYIYFFFFFLLIPNLFPHQAYAGLLDALYIAVPPTLTIVQVISAWGNSVSPREVRLSPSGSGVTGVSWNRDGQVMFCGVVFDWVGVEGERTYFSK